MHKNTKRSHTKEASQLQHISDVLKLEASEPKTKSWSDNIADVITAFSGSMLYVGLHVFWFSAWIIINLGLIHGIKQFDPFPFSLLTMIVSLEAIFLSSFVLISQNKQAQTADKRAKLDLQINIISERENSKMIQLISDIHHHLKLSKRENRQIKQFEKNANVTKLSKELEKAEEKDNN